MAILKRKRKVKLANGKKVIRQSQKWYTRLTDADGIKRTIPLFRDKTASQHELEAWAWLMDRIKTFREQNAKKEQGSSA